MFNIDYYGHWTVGRVQIINLRNFINWEVILLTVGKRLFDNWTSLNSVKIYSNIHTSSSFSQINLWPDKHGNIAIG